jgi:putative transposase
VTRYRCVDARKADGFTVTAACAAAGVSTSAYYAWAAGRDAPPTAAQAAEARLRAEIRRLHTASGGADGVRRITRGLRRRGWTVNRKKVARIMREEQLAGYRPRKRRSLTKPDEAAPAIPNLVGRLFDPDRPDVTWCGDITYIGTDEGWLYLATVIDLGSRRLLGWALGVRHDAQLVCDALHAAVGARGVERMPGVIFHSDRGSEYTSRKFAGVCAQLGVRQSASRSGSCLDNAVAESWFASLKVELTSRARYATRAQARAAITRWIHYYNTDRLHSTLGYLTPLEWEALYDDTEEVTEPLASPQAA